MFSHKKLFTGIVALMFVMSLFAGIQNSYADGSQALVETSWLAKNLDNPKVKTVFVDNWPSEKPDFMKAHVKGSVYMGIGALMGALNGGNPDKAKFEGIMNRLGINNGDHVVLYGAKGGSVFTLGAFWIMEYFGHKNLSYLNGALEKWNKEGLPSESGMKAAAPGHYEAVAPDESVRATAAHVLKSLNDKNTVIVDARGTGEYTGEVNNDKNKRVGHIPGARDLDAVATNFNADGTIKSAAELAKIYNLSDSNEVITYCQAGIKASNSYFAIKHILGHENTKVFVGSWDEWANRTDNPIEK